MTCNKCGHALKDVHDRPCPKCGCNNATVWLAAAGRVGAVSGRAGVGVALARTIGKVQYVDFGFTSVREYWSEIVVPAVDRFLNDETRANAIEASTVLWHLVEWLWHEQHPGEDTDGNKNYKTFCKQHFVLQPAPCLNGLAMLPTPANIAG